MVECLLTLMSGLALPERQPGCRIPLREGRLAVSVFLVADLLRDLSLVGLISGLLPLT